MASVAGPTSVAITPNTITEGVPLVHTGSLSPSAVSLSLYSRRIRKENSTTFPQEKSRPCSLGPTSGSSPSGPSRPSSLASGQTACRMTTPRRSGSAYRSFLPPRSPSYHMRSDCEAFASVSSDGPQPHFVTLEFPRKMAIQKLSLFLSFPLDDSYTPAALSIRAGTSLGDLQEVRSVTLDKPDGWITFDISAEPGDDGEGFKPVHAYILQVIVLTNHMNGKDTHVRGMRILGPNEDQASWDDPFPFVTKKFKMHEYIR
ncbi:hypothetical protein EVG20_g10653 [Dentipellis fragilis]|uniref:DOC domain-containing protein n=1 Tax=Dentipellis fragilis TaxID=205917 RepID=A0A4Y9XS40_9AGAM|nr:hypothetical protein EVG20_g10653 [Dentipellis fragilis]